MSSLFADLIDGIASFFAPDKTQPGSNGNPVFPTPDGRPIPTDPSTSDFNYAQLIQSGGRVLEAGIKYIAPLISAQVTKPNDTVNPAIPASTSNDPRVKAVLGVYGGGTNAPYTKEQSTFQLAFPGLLQNLLTDNGTSIQVPATQPGPTVVGAPLSPSSTTPASGAPTEQDLAAGMSTQPTFESGEQSPVFKKGSGPGSASTRISEYDGVIMQAAEKYNVPSPVIKAIIEQESHGDSTATGPKTRWGNARGLMQLLDGTMIEQGYKNPSTNSYNPANNVDAGARYLSKLASQFKDEQGQTKWETVFKAYFAGPTAVKLNTKDNGPKTKVYGRQVLARMKYYGG